MLQELYAPFLRTERPFLVMSPESAEMTKYAANAMLATKISFINEMANVCERLGADMNDVHRGIGHDAASDFNSSFPARATAEAVFLKTFARDSSGKSSRSVGRHDAGGGSVNDRQKQVLIDENPRPIMARRSRTRRWPYGAGVQAAHG